MYKTIKISDKVKKRIEEQKKYLEQTLGKRLSIDKTIDIIIPEKIIIVKKKKKRKKIFDIDFVTELP